ncbi:MAG: nicotinate-nucleotide--dimethylbenzimidazole phosphoribosyltransferase [Deltaproteobacteria bacterium]|jgi:nicotinate-nucleotide--dimethylbenzimidazole phosphoribosyltransferase|nr:nicotinate-nucleotide--dimethylbenzimidazole phosphoribosyltransferase [Deltaproteobacteria bacterium]
MNDRDYLFSIAAKIKPVNKRKFYKIAERRLNRLIKPKGSLGRLEDFAKDVVAVTEEERPRLNNKFVCVFAGDHGVVEEGVSLFKQDVTVQMVRNFLSGGAAINTIAESAGAEVLVIDVGINADCGDFIDLGSAPSNFINLKVKKGTFNIKNGPAMAAAEAVKSVLKGIETADIVKDKGAEICATGDMGIGNTTPASAITCFYSGKTPESVCGRGTGVNSDVIKKKAEIIEKAIKCNIREGGDAVDVLAGVGGLEIGAIAGFILGCAIHRIPVVVDGFISTAGALIALNINPYVSDYMFLGHLSKEKGHKTAVKLIGKTPILDLSMRLGEGTGAVIAMKIMETALNMYNNMLTFDEANVYASKLNR